jgi:hypothetical protein
LTHVYLCPSAANLQPKTLGSSCKITSFPPGSPESDSHFQLHPPLPAELSASLGGNIMARQTPEFVINQRQKRFHGGFVAGVPACQQFCDRF